MCIVFRALEEPLCQIVDNAGAEPSVVLARVLGEKGGFGYNALTVTGCMIAELPSARGAAPVMEGMGM